MVLFREFSQVFQHETGERTPDRTCSSEVDRDFIWMWLVFFNGSSQATTLGSAFGFLLGEDVQDLRFSSLFGSHITSYNYVVVRSTKYYHTTERLSNAILR